MQAGQPTWAGRKGRDREGERESHSEKLKDPERPPSKSEEEESSVYGLPQTLDPSF